MEYDRKEEATKLIYNIEEYNKEIQKKEGIISKTLRKYLNDVAEAKIKLLQNFINANAPIFKVEYDEFVEQYNKNTIMLTYDSSNLKYNYYVKVIRIKDDEIRFAKNFKISEKLLRPENINVYLDELEALLDNIVMETVGYVGLGFYCYKFIRLKELN